jgi:hypothetical protein
MPSIPKAHQKQKSVAQAIERLAKELAIDNVDDPTLRQLCTLTGGLQMPDGSLPFADKWESIR